MATVVEQRAPSHLGGMGYDQFRYAAPPQFTNPWASQQVPNGQSQLYPNPMQSANATHDYPPPQRTTTSSMAYPTNPAPATTLPQDVMQQSRSYTYPAQGATAQTTYPTSAPRYSPEHYPYPYDQSRSSLYNMKSGRSDRDGFTELDAGQGMVAMSQDITPRNIYGRNGSHDSYGFPAPHSQHSSISSSSGYYYNGSYNSSYSGSVDGSSVTDYSSASEDAIGSRTLPAPGQMVNGFPPEPGTMMSQFNSKLAPSAQKKHKCKICDKRFTRPSSLQTHMYSHTGEKPFVCDHEGCGRHFSVVSNLRRHKKVHKNGQEHPSPDED